MDVIDKYIDIYEKCQLSQYKINAAIWLHPCEKFGDIFDKLHSLELYILRYQISYEIFIFFKYLLNFFIFFSIFSMTYYYIIY